MDVINVSGAGGFWGGFILCQISLFLFIILVQVWHAGTFLVWMIMLILKLIRYIVRKVKGKQKVKKEGEEDGIMNGKSEQVLAQLFLPLHLICTLMVFSIPGLWLGNDTLVQKITFITSACLYSGVTYVAFRKGYADYLLNDVALV